MLLFKIYLSDFACVLFGDKIRINIFELRFFKHINVSGYFHKIPFFFSIFFLRYYFIISIILIYGDKDKN